MVARIRDIEDELSDIEDVPIFLQAAAEYEGVAEAEQAEAESRRAAETYLATTFPRALAKAKTAADVRALEEEHARFAADEDQPNHWRPVARKCARQASARIRELERAQRMAEDEAARRLRKAEDEAERKRRKEEDARVARLKREADAAEKQKLAAQRAAVQAREARLREERATLAAERREVEALRRRASQPATPAPAPGTIAAMPTARPKEIPRSPPAAPHATAQAPTARVPPSGALTGTDLRAWRTGLGLNQVDAAAPLGVTQGSISKAVCAPARPLGPSLQAALRRRLNWEYSMAIPDLFRNLVVS